MSSWLSPLVADAKLDGTLSFALTSLIREPIVCGARKSNGVPATGTPRGSGSGATKVSCAGEAVQAETQPGDPGAPLGSPLGLTRVRCPPAEPGACTAWD